MASELLHIVYSPSTHSVNIRGYCKLGLDLQTKYIFVLCNFLLWGIVHWLFVIQTEKLQHCFVETGVVTPSADHVLLHIGSVNTSNTI